MTQQPFAEVAETHSAVVYCAGDRAFKLKKPVKLEFLDFSTPQARAAACARETELNRRFAPDVYLGVGEVRAPDGQVCDHLVVMRRMPAARRLSALLAAGEPVGPALRQVARIVAAQHGTAARGPRISEQGSRDATRQRWHDNIRELQSAALDGLVPAAEAQDAGRLADRFLAGRGPLFEARIRAGRVIDGHGDLLADDIFCLDDGPRILDCLDFDDKLRWVDGLDDIAFLAMDLEQLGAADLAGQVIGWYSEFSGDPAPAALRHHYVAYRAGVRAKVSCIRARQDGSADAGEAGRLLGACLRHLRAGAVTLVLVGGPPGAGKSTLAGAVADRLGFTVLSSDRIRKELTGTEAGAHGAGPAAHGAGPAAHGAGPAAHGAGPAAHGAGPAAHGAGDYGTGIYSPAWTERTYAELIGRAAGLLAMGESVILDATWTSARLRQAAAAAAADVCADFVQLRCSAPRHVMRSRTAGRAAGMSDATPAIAAHMAAEQDPWPEAAVIDTSGASDPVALALQAIRPHG